MKKKAYTLAEVLIALSVVGIIAAICIPMANKFRPDTSKTLYLQTHDNLKQVLLGAAHNSTNYPETSGVLDFKYHPFANINMTENGVSVEHRNKLCWVLADSLVLSPEDNDINCSDTYTPFNGNNFTRSFTLKNGVEVMVTTDTSFATVAAVQPTKTNRYRTDIIIDINGNDEGANCVYNAVSCANPDRFLFKVSADGSLRALDYVGLYFLEHRTSLRKSKIVDNATVQNLLARNEREFPLFAIHSIDEDNGDDNGDDNGVDNGEDNGVDNGSTGGGIGGGGGGGRGQDELYEDCDNYNGLYGACTAPDYNPDNQRPGMDDGSRPSTWQTY